MDSCNPSRRSTTALIVAAIVVPCALPFAAARAEEPPKDFSPAERALFMTDQFAKLRPPLTLRYRFARTGSLEPAFEDKVSIALKAQAGTGRCCDAAGEFLSGERKVELPPVEGASGNPVTLFFLERDVREMERLTKGKSAYFRKRIRMAIYQGAQQRAVTLSYRGKQVAGQEFTVTPYVDDPNRPRFEQLANKRYVFTLSDAVPGGVYGIRALVADAAKGADAPPLIADELLIDGASPSVKAGS
jgi:hypothetical protein